MKRLILAMLAAVIMATAAAQTYNMEVSLKNGNKITLAADSVSEVRFKAMEVYNILTEKHIPDTILLNYIKRNIARGADTYTNIQASQYTGTIALKSQPLQSAKGIEFFTALSELDLSESELRSLDISELKQLRKLDVHYCINLASLNISGCDRLEEADISLTKLKGYSLTNFPKSIKKLDVSFLGYDSFNASIFPALEKLTINDNNLTSIDLTACDKINEVSVTGNQLTSATFDNCKNLQYLAVSYNPGLAELSLQGCDDIRFMFIHKTRLNGYSLSQFAPTLLELNISYLTGYKVEDLANLPYLTYLECEGCQLTGNLNLNGSPLLQSLRCEENEELKSLTLTECTELKELYCYSNPGLEEIVLPKDQSNIKFVNLFQIPKVSKINVGNMTSVDNLGISGSAVQRIDISGCNPTPSGYYYLYNDNLKEVKVWPTFDIANPPANITISPNAKFVYEFTQE